MPRRTLADALSAATRIPEAVNLPPTDARVISYINEAQDKLLKRGHWWGAVARYKIAVTSGLVTLPRAVACIERVAENGRVLPVHDFWFSWLDNGWGPVDEANPDGRLTCEYRGHYPVFSDIVGVNKALRLVCDLAIDEGKIALIQGYDDNTPPNWIRSQIGSSSQFQNGEELALARSTTMPQVLTGNFFGKVTDIQLPADMQGQCWLYEVDLTTGPNYTERLIGQYDAGNTRPSFARYFFPAIFPLSAGRTVAIEFMAKLDFVPVAISTDYLTIGNLPALKLACMAIKAEEELRFTDAALLMNGGLNQKTGIVVRGAIQELESELDHFLGAGRRLGMNIMGLNIGSVEEVPNLL